MNVNLEYKESIDSMVAEVLRMDEILEANQLILVEAIGKEIKKELKNVLPKSDSKNDGYQDAGGYSHMRDDIHVTVNGKRKKTGITGVTVHGGRDTAYKWHLLDDGTRNPDGTVHTKATHFTSKAMKAATPRIEQMIEVMLREVVK